MKRIIIGISTIIALGLHSCANRGTEASNGADNMYICGAYADYRALTDEDIEVFESAYNYGLQLTPQSVATQVVAGTNYKFICTDKAGNDVRVVIFQPLPNHGEPRVTGIETVSGQDTPGAVAVAAQIMYDDVMSMYDSGGEGRDNAFRRYASSKLLNLVDEVDDAIAKGDIDPIIYGWDCDPWIMAQDWSHPTAKVVKVYDLSDNGCMVDVAIMDGEVEGDATNITVALVKENGMWKVDDFALSASDADTFATMLKDDYESAR